MTFTYTFFYMGCQSCQARVHCEECEERLSQMLVRLDGVNGAVVQMANKQLAIDGDLDSGTLDEALEDLGIFVR